MHDPIDDVDADPLEASHSSAAPTIQPSGRRGRFLGKPAIGRPCEPENVRLPSHQRESSFVVERPFFRNKIAGLCLTLLDTSIDFFFSLG